MVVDWRRAVVWVQVRPGQTSDPTSGFATATGFQSSAGGASVAPTPSLTPMLGGGRTPLVGDAKVPTIRR